MSKFIVIDTPGYPSIINLEEVQFLKFDILKPKTPGYPSDGNGKKVYSIFVRFRDSHYMRLHFYEDSLRAEAEYNNIITAVTLIAP